MGMYDELLVDDELLPSKLKGWNKGWQSKSLDCFLNYIWLKKDNTIEIKEYNNDENSFKPLLYTGEIRFYRNISDWWYELVALVDEGNILKVKLVEEHKIKINK